MQNSYTGDVGDIGKYGMLRAICRENDLRLGVNWYLVPDVGHNNDGKLTSYLMPNQEKKFRPCDLQLSMDIPLSFESISRLQQRNQGHLAALETSRIVIWSSSTLTMDSR